MVARTKAVNVPKVKKPLVTQYATTIVEQGPRDDQTRVDGYGGHVGPLETQYAKQTLAKYTDDLYSQLNVLNKALNLPSLDLKGVLKNLQGLNKVIQSLNPEVLMKRIEDNVLGGRSINSILQLPEQFKRDALGTLANLTKGVNLGGYNIGELIRTGQMTYQDATRVYHMVKNNDWHSLDGIARGLSAIGGSALGNLVKPIIDLHATSAILGQYARVIADIGDSHLLKQVSGLFKDSRQRNAALGLGIMNAAARSDLNTVDAIVKVLGGSTTASNYPLALRTVVENYNLEPFYQPDQIDNYRQRLLATLNQIDPMWYYTYHNNEKVTKLDYFYFMSEDCRKILGSAGEPDFTTEIMISKSYPPVDMKQLIMYMYKDITFKDRPLDPRKKR